MGFEIPVDVDYFEHPKTLHLIALIGPEADIYPLRLWRWAALYRKDGNLGCKPDLIESSIGWKGRGKVRGRLIDALQSCDFVTTLGSPPTFYIHDWMQHIGRAIFIYEEKKRKQRELYAKKHGFLPEEFRKNSGSLPEFFRNSSAYPILSYSGNSGGDTADADAPPTPPPSASPEDPRSGESEMAKTLSAFDSFTTPGNETKEATFKDLLRQGVTHDQMRAAAKTNPTSDFYAAVKPLRNGKADAPFIPSPRKGSGGPTRTSRLEAQRRLDDARQRALEKLKEVEEEEKSQWTQELEAEIEAAKVPIRLRDGYVQNGLVIRAAKKFGIEGL